MFFVILLIITSIYSHLDACPNYCQCYSAFDGYHVTCQNAQLKEIPLNLIEFLRTTTHQNLIVDLTGNILSTVSCQFFQISTIFTLILNQNQLEYLPSCFSQSSIEYLHLNHNRLQFNQTTIISSSKLLHLDLSTNNISSLPRTFLTHLRRLRRLIIDGNENLFHLNNDQWIRSLTTRNQLTLIICNENFRLSLCLFDNLFQTKKLLAIELNSNLFCDCSFVYLPIDKIHFHYCQSQEQQGVCNSQSSPFEPGRSIIHLKNSKYRQICTDMYHTCRSPSAIPITITTTMITEGYTSTSVGSSSINQSNTISTMLTTTTTTIILRKENMMTGVIISLVLVLLILSIICLYVILSGHLFQMKNHQRTIDLTVQNKEEQQKLSHECIPIDNRNMNFNPQKTSFQSYYQRTNSSSDEETDLTFYSLNNTNPSSTSFLQTSITEMEITSITSTIDSSFSHETIVSSNHQKQRIY